jgi:hypothetical protein
MQKRKKQFTMNNQEISNDDLLRKYIVPEKIEEAPSGFTSKVMGRVMSESRPSFARGFSATKSPVPLISIGVIALLIAAAFMVSGSKPDSLTITLVNAFNSIKLSVPEKLLSSVFSLSLPSVIIYILTGIFFLTFLDRVLYGLFKREK